MCPHYCICVLILLDVSSYYDTCVLIRQHMCRQMVYDVSSYYYMCPHPTMYVIILLCVLILLHMCPYTTTCVSAYYYMCPHTMYVSTGEGARERRHTCIYVSSYYYVRYIYVYSYYYMCVLILHVCPHTTTCVSSYYYMCALILLYLSSYYKCTHTIHVSTCVGR
jgi:hypothetical protein